MGPVAFRSAGPPSIRELSDWWAGARSELVPPYFEKADCPVLPTFDDGETGHRWLMIWWKTVASFEVRPSVPLLKNTLRRLQDSP